MSQISKETQQAIEKQARSILNKYGEGSIYKKPGKKDQLQFLYDDETGTKRRKALSIPEGADPQQVKLEFIIQTLTKRYQLQQEQKKRQLLQETISKDFLEKVDKIVEALPETKKTLKPCNKTVNQVINEYLAYYKSTNVAYVSYHACETHLNKAKKLLGNRKISDITNEDFQNMLNNMRNGDNEEILSTKYAVAIKNDFVNMLKFARKKAYIASYYEIIEDVKIPKNLKRSNPDEKFLDYDQLAKVLYAVKDNFKYYTMLTVLTLTGLRSQELFALRKQDIDYENHKIHIAQATKMQERTNEEDRKYGLGTTKTETSTRYAPAIDSVLKLLKMWLQYCEKEGITHQAKIKGNEDLVFTNRTGDVINRDALLSNLEDYITRTKIEDVPHITFHMCRHCFATYLDREHCNLQIIQQCMGHTTKRGSVAEIHYIAPDPTYIDKVIPYLNAVESKLIDACKKVENEYKSVSTPKV